MKINTVMADDNHFLAKTLLLIALFSFSNFVSYESHTSMISLKQCVLRFLTGIGSADNNSSLQF